MRTQVVDTSRSPGFTVFSFTWTMAAMFHQLSFNDWRWYDPKGLMLSIAILPVLFKPSSWQRFAFYVLVDFICVGLAFPEHPNHIVFAWMLNGMILGSLVVVAIRNKGTSDPQFATIWFDAFAPWTRIMLCILYWFTFFHKLNTSYFDLDWSCAARLHLDIDERFHILPTARWAQYVSVYGTLVIELVLPILLWFSRTRVVAIVIGLLFHGLLALHPHPGLYSFSATMIALYTVFLPATIAEDLMPKVWMVLSRRWVVLVLGSALLIWITRKWLPAGLDADYWLSRLWKLGLATFYVYLGFCLVLFTRVSLKRWNERLKPQGTWSTYPVLAFFPIILFVNGIGPYFGLRTQSSFSMFSNLHTENGISNHFIMPSGIQFINWQSDLVEIIDTSDEDLLRARDRNLLVVYKELCRVRSDRKHFWVEFRHNGEVRSYDDRQPETHDVLPEMGFFAKRYFFFRPVDRDPTKILCKH